jgi:hypothetical protein
MNSNNMPDKICEGTIKYIKNLIAFILLVSEALIVEEQIKNRKIPDKIK